MRNSPYCNRFILNEHDVEENTTGIRYVNKKDFLIDQGCISVCNNVQRKICEVLNHFDKITKVIIIRQGNTDRFGDELPNYKRKLK